VVFPDPKSPLKHKVPFCNILPRRIPNRRVWSALLLKISNVSESRIGTNGSFKISGWEEKYQICSNLFYVEGSETQMDVRDSFAVSPSFYAIILFWSARRDDDNLNIPAQSRRQPNHYPLIGTAWMHFF
jgi:hypothetical protein